MDIEHIDETKGYIEMVCAPFIHITPRIVNLFETRCGFGGIELGARSL